MTPAIELFHVSKTYRRRVQALADVSICVQPGEIFGLLGPNGAGKSTLVKIMTSIVRPSRAEGSILGQPVGHKPTLARVGYLPENHRFPRYLTGRQTLEFFAALSGVSRATRRRKSAELIDLVGMKSWADARVGTYSKGMMQRIGLAQALVNDPDLVLLDEPTDGVDPVGRRDVRDVLLKLRDRGKTIFINSHLLSELEMVCNRVAILVAGKVAMQGTLDELTGNQQRYEIELDGLSPDWSTLLRCDPDHPDRLIDGSTFQTSNGTLRIATADASAVQPVLDDLRQKRVVIKRVQLVRPSLEDLFMSAVIDPKTGKAVAPGAEMGGRS